MPYVTNTGLRPLIITNNGAETNSFIQTPITYNNKDIVFATEFFNTVTGLFDTTKSTLYFANGTLFTIDQSYSDTTAQLIALN
jgi:hypothetical protein|tara:strand:+ start:602 stop:850 length:249 start_codon:yes stop_codon:yes gene_type:complete